jgi:hypothetical protein
MLVQLVGQIIGSKPEIKQVGPNKAQGRQFVKSAPLQDPNPPEGLQVVDIVVGHMAAVTGGTVDRIDCT